MRARDLFEYHNFTKEFYDWFGASKVVDQAGRPLRVWHYSPTDFETFHHGDVGFHFGTSGAASDRKRDRIEQGLDDPATQGFFKAYYLRITNPLDAYDRPEWSSTEYLDEIIDPTSPLCLTPFLTKEEYNEFSSEDFTLEDFRNLLIKHGYDGIRYRNTQEHAGSTSWIAFSNDQIRRV